MLGAEGWIPNADQAAEAGLITDSVPLEKLQARAQELGEQFIKEGRKRWMVEQGKVEEYKAVNARESVALADAFLSHDFLTAQYNFLKKKNRASQARAFWFIRASRPLWSKML